MFFHFYINCHLQTKAATYEKSKSMHLQQNYQWILITQSKFDGYRLKIWLVIQKIKRLYSYKFVNAAWANFTQALKYAYINVKPDEFKIKFLCITQLFCNIIEHFITAAD